MKLEQIFQYLIKNDYQYEKRYGYDCFIIDLVGYVALIQYDHKFNTIEFYYQNNDTYNVVKVLDVSVDDISLKHFIELEQAYYNLVEKIYKYVK